jgi:signal peptidase I
MTVEFKTVAKNFYEIFKTIAVMFLLAFLIRSYLIQTFVVEGRSMEPNFYDGEYLLIDKISYRLKEPQRGDVAVFLSPEDNRLHFIKRIIGLPGENIEITQNTIFINGQPLPEPYLQKGERTLIEDNFLADFKARILDDQFFVLGDNRQNSKDSRSIGLVPKKNITGRAFLVIYPLKNFGLVHGPNYERLSTHALNFDIVRVSL